MSELLLDRAHKCLSTANRRHLALRWILRVQWNDGIAAANEFLKAKGLDPLQMAVTMLSYAGNIKERIKKMAIEYESIGKRIKQFHIERNLSQEKLGELISMYPHHISQI